MPRKKQQIIFCSEPYYAKGLCLRHYLAQRLKDPDYRAKINKGNNERRMERYRQDPEYHARYNKQVVEYQKKKGPEYRAKLNEQNRTWLREKTNDPVYRVKFIERRRERHTEYLRERLEDPEYRARYNQLHRDYQTKRRVV